MATKFPGSGSTRGVPPKLVGGGAPAVPLWDVVHEVDFASEATVTWAANAATNTVAGKTWTARNITGVGTTYCSRMQLVNGVGFQIEFNGVLNDSELAPSVNTAPRIEIPVSSLVAGLAVDDTIAFQIIANSTTLDDDWQYYGLMLSDAATGTHWIENSTVFWSGGGGVPTTLGNDVQMGNTGRYLTAIGAEPPFREIVWYAGVCGFVAGADTSSSPIDPLSCTAMEASGPLTSAVPVHPAPAPSLDITVANAKLSLHAYYNDASGAVTDHNFTATWTKLRVLKRSK